MPIFCLPMPCLPMPTKENKFFGLSDIGLVGQRTVLGVGTDICAIARIEKLYDRFGNALLKRLYSVAEQDFFTTLPDAKKISFLAKRFAAKEACVKALGTGFGKDAFFQEITVLSDRYTRQPSVDLSGVTLVTCLKLTKGNIPVWHMSLSDEQEYALAFCVLSTEGL